jgi:hypothetical protein
MAVENVRRTCEDRERDPILKQMGEEGYTLVAVTDDGRNYPHALGMRFWSLYFTRVHPDIIYSEKL